MSFSISNAFNQNYFLKVLKIFLVRIKLLKTLYWALV